MDSKIYFEPTGADLYNVVYAAELSAVNSKMNIAALEKLCQKEPYNIEAAMTLAQLYIQNQEYAKACQVRFATASEIINAIPENEEFFELDWDNEENQEVVEILVASGTDFYMHGDFEMSATLFETALALDGQDNLGVIPQLALSYIAVDDMDGYEMLSEDIDKMTMEGAFIVSFEAFQSGKKNQVKLPAEFIAEIKVEEHPLGEEVQGRASKNVTARELWYKHMPILEAYKDFTDYCKQL